MSAVIEFGFDSAAVFSGVDKLDRRLRRMDDSVAVSQKKLAVAMKNPWVSAGIDAQGYLNKLVAAERQTRQVAAAHAKLASYKGPQAAMAAAVNPWSTAGSGQYAAQQDAAKRAAEAAAVIASQQRAAEAAAAAQQKLAAINAATQSKAMAAAAAAATVAAAEQRSASLKTNNGRVHLALLEAQIAGNKKEAASIQNRISMMERMRTIQQQTNVSQREAYTLAQRSAGLAAKGGGGGRGFAIGMAGMQAQDIAVQMQMGTRMSTIVAQQGSQLLSVFGPMGMLLGAVVAVGGAFFTARQKGEEMFQELKKESEGFDASLKALKSGGLEQMIRGMDSMGQRARDARDAAETRGSFTGAESRKQDLIIAEQNERGKLELAAQILRVSDQELRISQMRAAGRDREAKQIEDQIRLAKEWAAIDGMDADTATKDTLRNNAAAKILAEQQQADAAAAKEKAAEIAKIAQSQAQLDEQKKQAAMDQMSIAQRIAVMSVDAQKALAEENRLKGAAKLDAMAIIDAESRRVAIQAQILSSQKQLANEKQREAEAAKRNAEAAAEAAKQAAAAASTRRGAVMDTALEYKMLQAKAAGRKKEVEEIEKQQRVMERAARLESQNGLGKREALSLAIKMTDMEDRVNGKRRKIRGVQGVDLDPLGRNGLSGRPSGPLVTGNRTLSQHAVMSKNSGLNGFWNHQLGNIGQMGTNTSGYANQNAFSSSQALQATHQANAAAASAPGGGGPTVDVFLEKLISRLPPALAAAILSQT